MCTIYRYVYIYNIKTNVTPSRRVSRTATSSLMNQEEFDSDSLPIDDNDFDGLQRSSNPDPDSSLFTSSSLLSEFFNGILVNTRLLEMSNNQGDSMDCVDLLFFTQLR